MPCCARAGANLPVPLAPPSPPPLGDQRLWVLAQPAAGRPQLGSGGDASSSGGRRARGAGGGGGSPRGVPLAFSYLLGHGRAGAAGLPPAARGGCLLLLLPLRPPRGASVPTPAPLPSQPRPRGPQRRRLRQPPEGGAWLSGGHVCEHRAGVQPGGGDGGGTSLSLLPGARERARAPRPQHWEGAIGKRQRRPAAEPSRDRRRRRVFPAPPWGRAPDAGLGVPRPVRAPGVDRAWPEVRGEWVLAADPRPRALSFGFVCAWLFVGATPLRISFLSRCVGFALSLLVLYRPSPSTHPTATP